ncbi:hypothetical protein ACVKN3_003261 [Luteibacter sp. PvP120]
MLKAPRTIGLPHSALDFESTPSKRHKRTHVRDIFSR